ncbi:hypothetical protein HYH02_007723 [Chlamydomonas schloesseri]|uniref:Uncharacterized protein n=1 Tax=Chlamydomonas schloesseri TaxID=2026947 RepID=A0A836B4I4_9CHLO|nr:hypothetical protein HYH02_007723 [Chlamydomonas schloesseri]|eukprot:KAG2447395.1 hypothetical protein HYH02_007723 [Chlamydomonas schloesseri]
MLLTSASERFEAVLVVALMVPFYFLAQLGQTYCDARQTPVPSVLIARVGWPCEASHLQKLILVLRNLPQAVWDELHQPGAQAFISANFVCVFARALAAQIVPARLYEQVLAPAVVYFTRVSSLAGLLLMGPTAEPSSISLSFFSEHIATDVLQVLLFVTLLGTWNVDARVELAACLLEAACALTCLSWHGAKVPGGPPHPAALLAGRALVPLVNLGLAYAAGRWRPAALGGRSAADTPSRGKQKGQSKAMGSPKGGAKCDEGMWFEPSAATDAQDTAASGRGSGGSGSTAALQQPAQAPRRMGPDAVQAPSEASLQQLAQQQVAAVSPPAQPPYRAFQWHTQQAQQLAGAAAGLNIATVGLSDTGVSPAAGRHVGTSHRQPHPPYRSFVRHVTTHYKIPWAEPEDITPGFEERLAALCAARGRVLTGVYVRAGCIELTLTLADRAGRGRDTAGHIDADETLSCAELAAALGLSMSFPMAARSFGRGQCFGIQPPLLQQQIVVQRATAKLHGCRDSQSFPARVVDVSPRVLLLPLPRIATDGAAAVEPAVLRLRVAFSGGAGPAAADDVVVRCGSGYLAVRVAAKQLSAADEGEAVGAQEWEYAVELVEPPPHPQLLTVQLAFPAAAVTASAGAGDTHNAPVQWLSVPVLALDDAAVAAELGAELLQQQVEQPDASSACMEELVCDLGQWLASASGADATTAGAVRGGLPAEWVSELGAHLLEYAEGAGLVATAARIRAGAGQLTDGPVTCVDGGPEGSLPPPSADAAVSEDGSSATDTGTVAELSSVAKDLRWRGARSSGKSGTGDGAGCSSKGQCKGISNAGSNNWSSARSGLQEYTEAWIVTMCKTCQMVECLVAVSFAALGLRAGQTLWCAESAVVYAGLGMGTVTTLAGLWMTPRAWSRLALAARLPRFLGFMTSKFLLSAGALPPPAGAATYAGGPGILLLEGVILPSGCLLPPRTALLMSCLKLPLNLMSGLAVGAFAGPLPAALMALAVEAAALGTTLACHAYVKRRHVKLQIW